jgi:DNA-binding transcriptional MerR regulator
VKDGLTVGGVASAAGVTPDSVRYYERLRLLSKAPRTSDFGPRRCAVPRVCSACILKR